MVVFEEARGKKEKATASAGVARQKATVPERPGLDTLSEHSLQPPLKPYRLLPTITLFAQPMTYIS
jgi:hypothetical protein